MKDERPCEKLQISTRARGRAAKEKPGTKKVSPATELNKLDGRQRRRDRNAAELPEPIVAVGNERRDETGQPIGRAIAKGAAVGQRINRFQSFEVCSQRRSTQRESWWPRAHVCPQILAPSNSRAANVNESSYRSVPSRRATLDISRAMSRETNRDK